MTLTSTLPNFSALLSDDYTLSLMTELALYIERYHPHLLSISFDNGMACITEQSQDNILIEKKSVASLITLFNTLFADQTVVLMHSEGEPEYFSATQDQPARIAFAHGFFASALHECSHWCIAGQTRRRLDDFGYWYAADGRSQTEQQAFELVEVKPQALECLFTLACHRPFQVSEDNLFADYDTGTSGFAHNVYEQALRYIDNPKTLPRDAKVLLWALLTIRLSKNN